MDTENTGNTGKPAGGAQAAGVAAPPKPAAAKAFEPPRLHLSASPHVRSPLSVTKVMLAVIIALIPALAAAVIFFGASAAKLTAVCVVSAVAAEAVANLLLRRGQSIGDLSAVITGILVAFNLPPSLPLWMAALGSVFAIIVAKMVFGGLGCNFINPALAGRAFLVASYPAPMTAYPATVFGSVNGLAGNVLDVAAPAAAPAADAVSAATPAVADTISSAADSLVDTLTAAFSTAADAVSSATSATSGSIVDAVSSATPLAAIKYAFAANSFNAGDFSTALADLFIGNVGGCIGETSALALLVGGIFLMAIRAVDVRIPLTYILTVFALFWIANGTGTHFTVNSLIAPTFHILGGGLFLGAFFMATDPVTSPITPRGRILFGVGCGILTFVIRKYGGYPEGVSFSILLMNLTVPLIDRYTRPAIYGEVKKRA